MKNATVSIVIPAYNEKENYLRGALEEVKKNIKNRSYIKEIIISDDGSNDGSLLMLRDFVHKTPKFKLLENKHIGKASAVYAGVQIAQAQLVLMTDFDQATPLTEIDKLLPFIAKKYDIAIGSREIKGARREKEPFYRHIMGKIFNMAVRLFVFGGIADTQCGFKLFRTEVIKKLFGLLSVYPVQKQKPIEHAFTGAVDVELLFLANKLGLKIAEVPVYWRHYHTTRVNPIRDSLKMFWHVVKIRLYDLAGYYENK